ncbi:MAG: hypothetical protein OXU33_06935 [Gemmatimonadota bacterium]|nr:hypothetical protein [Gemmatimonadota bacterium]MDE3006670.1 hypothetical protein [Gemmatimonadota bacterium]MDE3013792.1 hypothetical protein [Gemmatimonadota bacterium]
MEELIFFAVIIFFSIIESIARSRKAKSGGGPVEEVPTGDRTPGEWEFEWEQTSPADLPTYDDDPSYDDEATRSGSPPPPAPRGIESQKSSSRTMLPGGLLEELAGMAEKLDVERKRMEQAEADARAEARRQDRARSDRAEEQERWVERQRHRDERARERVPMSRRTLGTGVPATRGPARAVPSHTLHQAHAEYGTDPSERSPSEQDGLDPLERTLSRDAKAVRVQLLSDSASALRQAVILQEVLGPPKAAQEDVV